MLTSEDVTELLAAEAAGLIPDPWLQTGIMAATIANCQRGKEQKAFEPEDFLFRVKEKPDIAAELNEQFHFIKGMTDGGYR